jgi:hypothetical protein
MRLLSLAALLTVVFFIYYMHHDSTRGSSGIQDFYHRTKDAMDGNQGTGSSGLQPADRDKDGDIDADDETIAAEMQERLQAAASKAKELANEKAGLRPDPPSKINGVGSSADGQQPGAVEGSGSGSSGDSGQIEEVSEEARDTEAELNLILKKSPSMF